MTRNISSDRAIENLIARYSFLVDDGDFNALGELLEECEFTLGVGPTVRGKDEIISLAHDMLTTYDDGTPRTRHITTNLLIEIDESAGTAWSQSYYTVLQSCPDFPLQPIATGTYRDSFALRNGRWIFTARSVQLRFAGDISRHRRTSPP